MRWYAKLWCYHSSASHRQLQLHPCEELTLPPPDDRLKVPSVAANSPSWLLHRASRVPPSWAAFWWGSNSLTGGCPQNTRHIRQEHLSSISCRPTVARRTGERSDYCYSWIFQAPIIIIQEFFKTMVNQTIWKCTDPIVRLFWVSLVPWWNLDIDGWALCAMETNGRRGNGWGTLLKATVPWFFQTHSDNQAARKLSQSLYFIVLIMKHFRQIWNLSSFDDLYDLYAMKLILNRFQLGHVFVPWEDVLCIAHTALRY